MHERRQSRREILTKPIAPSFRLAAAFLIFGVAWVFFGNLLLQTTETALEPAEREQIEVLKGIAFVVIGAALIWIIQYFEFRRLWRVVAEGRDLEVALERQQQRLQDILSGSRAGTWEWNIRTGETRFNERWAEIVGYSLDELAPVNIGTWQRLCHPDDLALSDRALQDYFDGKADYYECEVRMLHKAGHWVWVVDRGKVVEWDLDKKPVRIAGTHNEINAQKIFERKIERLLQVQRALVHSHTAINHLVDEQELRQSICDILVSTRDYKLVWFGFPDNDPDKTVVPIASSGAAKGYLDGLIVRWGDDEFGNGPSGLAIKTNQIQLNRVMAESNTYFPWLERASKFGLKSSISIPVVYNSEVFGVLNVYSENIESFDDDEVALLRDFGADLGYGLRSLKVAAREKEAVAALRESSIVLVGTVAATLEKRDPYTSGHQQRVADLCVAIAKELGWGFERVEGLRLGALIHDIGKIYVPAEILSRTGKLTESEFAMIRSHPQIGAEIIGRGSFECPIKDMILQHHERLDGSGYPSGLKGEEIIPEARVIAVADVVEAIASHRPYHPALGLVRALEEIGKNRGKYYDPAVVDACLKVIQSGFDWQ